jgi:hypothetical protein
MCFRYDVELYQRIEHLIGKKLPLYKTEEEEVMQLMERVTEAQRYAKMVSVKNIMVHLYIRVVCIIVIYVIVILGEKGNILESRGAFQ